MEELGDRSNMRQSVVCAQDRRRRAVDHLREDPPGYHRSTASMISSSVLGREGMHCLVGGSWGTQVRSAVSSDVPAVHGGCARQIRLSPKAVVSTAGNATEQLPVEGSRESAKIARDLAEPHVPGWELIEHIEVAGRLLVHHMVVVMIVVAVVAFDYSRPVRNAFDLADGVAGLWDNVLALHRC